jgi:hypothetical protein
MKSLKIQLNVIVLLLSLPLISCSRNIYSITNAGTKEIPSAENNNTTYPVLPSSGSTISYPSPNKGITPLTVGDLPPTPDNTIIPVSGKASLSGVLFSYTLSQVVPDTRFYLTPAVGKDKNEVPSILLGPNPNDGDYSGFSDQKGDIEINNIEPGNYYLIIWSPITWAIAEMSDQNQKPLLIILEPNQRRKLGVIYVSWP